MIAIIGDLQGSRHLPNREFAQDSYFRALDFINQRYTEAIVSNFTITLGDEFQGVVSKNPLRILDEITCSMHPIKLRFGIGIGKLSTEIKHEVSLGADGPAYWFAREAIHRAKKENDYKKSNIHLLGDGNNLEIPVINEVLKLTAILQQKWTDPQMEVFKTLLENDLWTPNFDQKKISALIGIDDSSLARRLRSSDLKKYIQSRNIAEEALERINQQNG